LPGSRGDTGSRLRGSEGTGASGPIEFTSEPPLDSRLRGRTLNEESFGALEVDESAGDLVLARKGFRPTWIRKVGGGSQHDLVAVDLPELLPGELLRDRIVPRRWLAGLTAIPSFETCARTRIARR
jgi:hypothetical protein